MQPLFKIKKFNLPYNIYNVGSRIMKHKKILKMADEFGCNNKKTNTIIAKKPNAQP